MTLPNAMGRALNLGLPVVGGLLAIAAAIGVLVTWPGPRLDALEQKVAAQERVSRAMAIWLCLNTPESQQDLLDLPCYELLRNTRWRATAP